MWSPWNHWSGFVDLSSLWPWIVVDFTGEAIFYGVVITCSCASALHKQKFHPTHLSACVPDSREVTGLSLNPRIPVEADHFFYSYTICNSTYKYGNIVNLTAYTCFPKKEFLLYCFIAMNCFCLLMADTDFLFRKTQEDWKRCGYQSHWQDEVSN